MPLFQSNNAVNHFLQMSSSQLPFKWYCHQLALVRENDGFSLRCLNVLFLYLGYADIIEQSEVNLHSLKSVCSVVSEKWEPSSSLATVVHFPPLSSHLSFSLSLILITASFFYFSQLERATSACVLCLLCVFLTWTIYNNPPTITLTYLQSSIQNPHFILNS